MVLWNVQPLGYFYNERCPIMVRDNAKTIYAVKTRLPDYHDSAANVANSAFYSNHVTASRPIATSKQKPPVILWPNP